MKRNNLLKKYSALVMVTTLGSIQVAAQPSTTTPAAQSTATSKPKMSDKLSGELYVSTSLEDTRDRDSKSTLTNVTIYVDLNYKMHRTLSLNMVPRLDFDNGYKNEPETSETNKPALTFRNLSADFKPVDIFEVSVGALNQRKMHSSGFINNTAFPGIRATLKGANSENQPGLKLQTAIPTSTTLTTNTEDSEKMPSFNSAGLFYNLGKKYTWKTFVNFYQFSNLPSTIAKSSESNGNTVEKTGDVTKFKYDYSGAEGGTSFGLPITESFKLKPAAYYMQNSSAPSELNQGYRGVMTGEFQMNDEYSLDATYDYFRIEPDAMVGFFGNRRYQTNRIGYLIELGFSVKDSFRLSIFGIERDAIYEIPSQTREQNVGIVLETVGASF